MELFKAVMKVAGEHGVKALGGALMCDPAFGDLAVDLFKALTQTENRLDERLEQIEGQLDEMLEQQYIVALRAGLRHLLDMDPTQETATRLSEIGTARRYFVEAASAARTDLQDALAERYLLLTAIMLGNATAARQASDRLDLLTTEALIACAMTNEDAEKHGTAPVKATPWRRPARAAPAASSEASLSRRIMVANLFAETGTLAELAGYPRRAQFLSSTVPGKTEIDCLEDSRHCQAGVISVTWKTKDYHKSSLAAPLSSSYLIERIAVTVDVVVRLLQPLRRPVPLNLELHTNPTTLVGQPDVLAPGERELEILVRKQALPYSVTRGVIPQISLNAGGAVINFRASLSPAPKMASRS